MPFRKPIYSLAFLLFAMPVMVCGQVDRSSELDAFFSFEGLRPNNAERVYELNFLKDSAYVYDLQSDSTWILSEREIFSYDNQGNTVFSRIDRHLNDTWNSAESKHFYYDHDGRLQKRINSYWSDEEQNYRLKSRDHFYYNFAGKMAEQLSEIRVEDDWQLFEKREVEYDSNFLKSREIIAAWNNNTLNWELDFRIIYTYNDFEEISSETVQIWVDSLNSWINKYSEEYYYGPQNRLLEATRKTWNPLSESWEGLSIVALSYNAMGQLESTEQFSIEDQEAQGVRNIDTEYDENGNLDLIVYEEWSTEEQDWVAYQRQDNFWSEYITGNLNESPDDLNCVFANPYIPGLPWYCEGLLGGEEYTLTVYDLQGRIRHQQIIKGGDTFRPGGILENGMYIVSIHGGLTAHQEKVLVRK